MIDIEDMQKTNESLKRKLKGLAELSEYDSGKLGVYEDATYISWNYFQGFQRRFYGESIDTLIVFLENTIEDYYIFYNMIVFFLILNNEMNNEMNNEHLAKTLNVQEKIPEEIIEKLLLLQKENEKFIKKLYTGLVVLKYQYESNNTKRISITALMHKVHALSTLYIDE